MPSENRCKSCVYFELDGGFCCRKPPTVVVSMLPNGTWQIMSAFPDVYGDRNWCGEFKAVAVVRPAPIPQPPLAKG